jgi:GT2 family glycosyltransferase
MDIILLILNYNDYINTKELIKSIINYKIIDKIIIVDNNSTDNSFEFLKLLQNNKVDIIRTKKNRGYAYGNNFGIKFALKNYNPKYFIISNPDVRFEEYIVNQMEKKLTEDKSLAAINPKILDLYGQGTLSGWDFTTFISDIINLFYLGRLLNTSIKKRKKNITKSFEYKDILCGCFFMIKASILEDINFFDERTFLYSEERILGSKIKNISKRQGTLNIITCTHKNLNYINENLTYKINRNKILYNSRIIYYKYYYKLNNLKILLFIILSKISLLEISILFQIRKLIMKNTK